MNFHLMKVTGACAGVGGVFW